MFTFLLILITLTQPPVEPPPAPTPIVIGDPCDNMTPYPGAHLPTSWILPDGTDCTPEAVEVIVIEDAYAEPPAPVFEDTPPVIVEVEPMRVQRFAHVSRAGELK